MNITELDKFKLEDAVKFHDELNPRLFDGSKLRPVIKHQLQEIAKDFIEFMGIPTLAIEDVIITGSNVAYTYTPHSDIDLHLLVDFSKLPDNEVYQELFKAKKTLYNNTYDITVRDIPVELYVQDTAQPHVSLGEYSLVQDKLTRIPTKKRANFDQASAAAKFERLEELCIEALKSDSLQKVEKVLDIIKRYRQAGLDKHGEFGPENLAFKAIRSKGYFQKLHDHKNYLKSEELSIEEMRKRKQFEESIGIQKILDKPTPTVEELAQKYNVPRQKVLQQLDKGIKIEKEHTSDREAAKQIALDHLGEKLEYYELLAKFDESLMRYPQKFDQYGMPDYELYLSLIDRLVKKGYARKDIIQFLMTKFDDIDTRDARDLLIRYQITHPSQAWIKEGASGYIPSEAEKDDPRFKMALTVDIKPDTMQKNAKKLGWNIKRDGRPPLLRPDNKSKRS
jgi:hypothetical protein